MRKRPLVGQRFLNREYRRVSFGLTPRLRHAEPEQRPQHQQQGGAHQLVECARPEPDRFDADEQRWRLGHERGERSDTAAYHPEREGAGDDG